MKRLFPASLIVALLVTGCGGGDDNDRDAAADNAASETEVVTEYKEKDPVSAPAPEGAASGATPTTAGGGGMNAGGTNAGGTNSAGADSNASTTTTRPPFPVELKLEKDCVKRGANGDTQALVAKTRPGDTVAYSTEYSDRSNELSNPSYKSGSGYGDADGKGNFRAEWKVPDNAPSGIARLHVIADGRIHSELTFKVVGPLESCS